MAVVIASSLDWTKAHMPSSLTALTVPENQWLAPAFFRRLAYSGIM